MYQYTTLNLQHIKHIIIHYRIIPNRKLSINTSLSLYTFVHF